MKLFFVITWPLVEVARLAGFLYEGTVTGFKAGRYRYIKLFDGDK